MVNVLDTIYGVINNEGGFPDQEMREQFDVGMDLLVAYYHMHYGTAYPLHYGSFMDMLVHLAANRVVDEWDKQEGAQMNMEMETIRQSELGLQGDIF